MSDITKDGGQQAALLDRVFNAVQTSMPQLMLPLLNSVFGTEFTGDERVGQETVLTDAYDLDEEKYTLREDPLITVTGSDGIPRTFHVNAQAGNDGEIIGRTYEYDMQLAFKKIVIQENRIEAHIPESAVVCLRPAESDGKKLTYWLVDPKTDERVLKQEINMLYIPNMTVDEIFAEQLYALLPLYLLTHGDRLAELEQSEVGREKLIREAQSIADRIAGTEALTPEQQLRLLELISVAARGLLEGETAQEISDIMQKHVSELDLVGMLDASKTEGFEAGTVATLVQIGQSSGQTEQEMIHDAAHSLGTDEAKARVLYEQYLERKRNIDE